MPSISSTPAPPSVASMLSQSATTPESSAPIGVATEVTKM
jgi:hypothetical protein